MHLNIITEKIWRYISLKGNTLEVFLGFLRLTQRPPLHKLCPTVYPIHYSNKTLSVVFIGNTCFATKVKALASREPDSALESHETHEQKHRDQETHDSSSCQKNQSEESHVLTWHPWNLGEKMRQLQQCSGPCRTWKAEGCSQEESCTAHVPLLSYSPRWNNLPRSQLFFAW